MRWIIRFLMTLFVLAALAIGALLLVPGDRIAKRAGDAFEEATGRAIIIDDDVRALVFPQLGIRTGPVTIANADWSENGSFIQAEGLEVGVKLSALLAGRVEIEKITLLSPNVLLERAADGRENWVFETSTSPSQATASNESTGEIPPFSIDSATFSDGSLRFIDHGAALDVAMTDIDANLSLPSFEGTAEIDFDARVHGQTINVAGQVGEFGRFLNGAVTPLDVQVQIGGSSMDIAGRGGYQPPAFDGSVTAALDDMPAVFAALGQASPDIPEGFGRQIAFNGALIYTPEQTLHLRSANLTLDQNRLTGEADIVLSGERPAIAAQFQADQLDFSSLAKNDGEAVADAIENPDAEIAKGWSEAPIDAGFLHLADTNIAFSANGITLGTLTLGPTRATAAIDRSRVVFNLREVITYGGVVAGDFVMNNRNGLSVGGDLSIVGVSLQPLLTDLAGYERLIGVADMRVKFLGVGNSMHAIMNNLSGDGEFLIGEGELRGLDLVGMLRNLDLSYEGEGQKTIFETVSAGFTIADGVLSNDDLDFQARLMTATGEGVIGIGSQTFDYRVVPVALQTEEGTGGVTVPVLITGTWADPKFRPDLNWLLEREAEAEREALEQRLREDAAAVEDSLREQVNDALEVDTENGESVEDALERKVEEEAERALRRILGIGD